MILSPTLIDLLVNSDHIFAILLIQNILQGLFSLFAIRFESPLISISPILGCRTISL